MSKTYKLRPYQEEGAAAMHNRIVQTRLVYMGWDVRTGKTATCLDLIRRLRGEQPNKQFNALFLTTKKAIGSVKSDYENFGHDFSMTTINYESMHKVEMPDTNRFDVVVCDEAHKLGAYPKSSNRTSEVKMFIDEYTHVILMSGTPAAESQSQLYHQLSVSPYSPWSGYGNFYHWSKDFVNVTKKNHGYGDVNVYDDAIVNKVEPCIRPIWFSKTQEEAGVFKQTIQEHILMVPMKDVTKMMVEKVLKDRVIIGNDPQKRIIADTAAKLQQKVHQLCSGTIKFDPDDEMNQTSMTLDDSKALFVKNRFAGQSMAILYNFIQEGKMLEEVFPNHTRDWQEFDRDPSKVFIGQIVSNREGISLWKADHLIYFNIPFSAVSYLQGRDRLTKSERTKENNVWFLCADFDDAIEERIIKRVRSKEDYNERLFRLDYNISTKGVRKEPRKIGRGNKGKNLPPSNQTNIFN